MSGVMFILSIFFCSRMNGNFGYKTHNLFLRDWMFYVTVQAVIFIKVVAFYTMFGHGISYFGQPLMLNVPFMAVPVFGNLYHVWEYFFHQLMHIFILFWTLLLAKHIVKVDWLALGKLFFIAVVLHNIGYWFTFSHPSLIFSLRDFATDFVALFLFFALFRLGFKLVPQSKKWTIPLFDEVKSSGAKNK